MSKPKREAYIAYQWKPAESQDTFGTMELLGWDTVNEDELSKYQALLGQPGILVYKWEFWHKDKPLAYWDNLQYTYKAVEKGSSAYEYYIPQDLRMKELLGAL